MDWRCIYIIIIVWLLALLSSSWSSQSSTPGKRRRNERRSYLSELPEKKLSVEKREGFGGSTSVKSVEIARGKEERRRRRKGKKRKPANRE